MTVSLTPKAFETLLCLVRSPGRILTKDELLKQIWPDTFVEEVNLAVNISALRKALGETPQEARYIATVPGHGYRFIAEVQELEWDEREDESEKETPAEHDHIDLSAVASKFTFSNHKFQSAGDTIDGALPTDILVHSAGKGPALPIRIVIVLLCIAMAEWRATGKPEIDRLQPRGPEVGFWEFSGVPPRVSNRPTVGYVLTHVFKPKNKTPDNPSARIWPSPALAITRCV